MLRYRIIVSGGLGEVGREAFRDFHIETHGRDTVLTGDLDQPGLLGALARIEGLGLELVGFRCGTAMQTDVAEEQVPGRGILDQRQAADRA